MFYEKKVNIKSKKEMAQFLSGHFRYHTMSSWNRSSSYAHCVKVDRLGLPRGGQTKAFEILETEDYWRDILWPVRDFEKEFAGDYSIVTNGRSSGYLVLCEAEYYDPGYKSCCPKCGQLNYREVTSSADLCGVCRAPRSNLKKPLQWLRVKGSGIDDGMSMEDFMDLPMSTLAHKVDLVCEFDRTCDLVRDAFLELVNDFYVVEETIMVPQKVLKLERISA